MMPTYNINHEEILTFFLVLVRFTVLFAVMPFIGDKIIPGPAKVILGLALSIIIFPALVSSGQIRTSDARVWARTAGGIVGMVGLEAILGLILGYIARLSFEAIAMGANLVGNFMGFASASIFDPHQESQTEVVAQVQTTIAMLLFLSLDGHHLMLKASFDSYRWVGLGKVIFSGDQYYKVVQLTGEVLRFGFQIATPVALCLFAVNVIFGMISKAIPQMNILVLSFAVTASLGFLIMFLCMSEFQEIVSRIFSLIGVWMRIGLMSLSGGH